MKTIKQLLVLASFGLLASTANATLMDLGTEPSFNGDANELAGACAAIGVAATDPCPLVFDYKYDSFPLSPDPQNAAGVHGDYVAQDYTLGVNLETTATVDLSWLMDAGWGLRVIGVKQARDIRWWGVSEDMRVSSDGFMEIISVAGETGISHLSLFSAPFAGGPPDVCPPGTTGTPPDNCVSVTVPEPGTLGLLGLGLLGLGLRRRSKA